MIRNISPSVYNTCRRGMRITSSVGMRTDRFPLGDNCKGFLTFDFSVDLFLRTSIRFCVFQNLIFVCRSRSRNSIYIYIYIYYIYIYIHPLILTERIKSNDTQIILLFILLDILDNRCFTFIFMSRIRIYKNCIYREYIRLHIFNLIVFI